MECLIGLLVLSLGLLGGWAMLLEAIRAQGDARHRSVATRLLRDMADRIRANPLAREAYDLRAVAEDIEPCGIFQPCEPARVAAADLAYFAAAARSQLPGAQPRIEFEPAIGPAAVERYFLALEWRGPRDDVPGVVTLTVLAQPVAG